MPATKVKFVLPVHTIRSLNAAEHDLRETLEALDKAWWAKGDRWKKSREGHLVNDWLRTLTNGLLAIEDVREAPE